jgi:ABC-2 type transport system permease protein
MNILSLIIKREFIAKVRNKSFIVMTFLSPLLFVGMAVLVGYLSTMNKDSVTQIAIHDEAGLLRKEFKNPTNSLIIQIYLYYH